MEVSPKGDDRGIPVNRKDNFQRKSSDDTNKYFHEELDSETRTLFPHLTFPLLCSSQLSQGSYLYW